MVGMIQPAYPRQTIGAHYGDQSVQRLASVVSSVNNTLVKGSAGTLHAILVGNTNASARFLKLYDKATAPVAGTDTPLFTVPIPPNTAQATVVFNTDIGIPFVNGIGFAITTGVADSDTGQTSADDVHGVLLFS